MNNFKIIPETTTLRKSLPMLMDNDRTALTCSSGTTMPSADALNVGRLFFHANERILRQCFQNSSGVFKWSEIAHLDKTPVYTDTQNVFAAAVHTHSQYARTDQSSTFNFGVTVNQNLTVKGALLTGSDLRIKHDITPITGALRRINRITGMQYVLNSTLQPQYGVIAQDVQKVAPFCVGTLDDEHQTLAVNYNGLVAILIEAVKTLSQKIDRIEKLVI